MGLPYTIRSFMIVIVAGLGNLPGVALSGQGLVQTELKNYEKANNSYIQVQKIYPAMQAPKLMIPRLKELIKGQST